MAVGTFSSLLAAGIAIHQFTLFGRPLWGFAIVFALAGCMRMLSANAFTQVADPEYHIPDDTKFSFWRFISRVRHSNFVRFVLFVSSMNFAVALAGPYFAMYMLKDLAFSYSQYTLVVATAVLAQFVVMRSWGLMSDQFGNRKILTVSGWLVACNPFFWLVSSNFLWILVVQLYSGFFWAGFNLAAANFVFDAVSPPKRARCVAYQAIINGVLVCLGSLAGGLIVTYSPAWIPTSWGGLTTPSVFLFLFLLSGLLRVLAVVVLLPAFHEVRAVKSIGSADLLVRVSAIRPLSGATFSLLSGKNESSQVKLDDTERLA
jgi:MFS family permease